MDHFCPQRLTVFLNDHPFALKATQANLSFTVLERIFHRLKSGNIFDTIKADEACIIHGHHRYLCLCLLEMVPEISPWVSSPANNIIQWHDIIISSKDWDTREEIEQYDRLYGKIDIPLGDNKTEE